MHVIDTHAHLDHLENLDESLADAAHVGVEAVVTVSMDVESCRKNLVIKRNASRPKILLAMGIHPERASRADLGPCLDLIRQHAGDLAAVGEIGLDFWYQEVRKDPRKKEEQMEVFRALLEVAVDLHLPAVIHSRGAWRECRETAKAAGVKKAVFHWYSGPLDVLKDILADGYYVSASPSLAYSPPSREAIGYAPIERILIETDCPVYYRNKETGEGFQAGPKDVFKTLEAYCALKGLKQQEAADRFNANAREFFNLKQG